MEYTNSEITVYHMLAGCFIAGKSYLDYSKELADTIPLNKSDGAQIKGNKTLKAFTNDCYLKIKKHMGMLEDYLKGNTATYKMTLDEIERIEGIVSTMIMLSPNGQQRVKGLIDKLKNEDYEIKYWQQIENDTINPI